MREVMGFSLDLVIAPLQRVASPAVSLFLWLFGEKIEQRMCAAVGFLGLDLDRFLLRCSPIRLLVRRRFGLPLLRLWWVSASGLGCHLARVGASRFSSVSSGAGSPFPSMSVYRVPCALSSQVGWCSSTIKVRVGLCLRFKGWSSMPPQWPPALPPHFESSLHGSLVRCQHWFFLLSLQVQATDSSSSGISSLVLNGFRRASGSCH
ncbi:hypothetical protein YC2023_102436 [Brassica napus]